MSFQISIWVTHFSVFLRLPTTCQLINYTQDTASHDLEAVTRLDNQMLPDVAPSHGIQPVWLGTSSDMISLHEANVLLTDFGESFPPSTTARHYTNTPALTAPPENRFRPDEPLSFPSDIWGFACLIYELLRTRLPFEGLASSADWMTMEQVTVLGKLPDEWWTKWDNRLSWLNEDGEPKNPGDMGERWDARFEAFVKMPRREDGLGEITSDEKEALLAMLKAMLGLRIG